MKELNLIAIEYFRENPKARDGVMKAYYAYHVPHFRCDPKAHSFGSSMRESACRWCGRTREQVRWDELPPECAKRPPMPEIDDVILGEERKAFALLARAEKEVPKLVSKLGMTGETLAVLHHTYGYDPETVASIVDVPPQMLADYHAAMEKERARSRAAQAKEVITARTTERATIMKKSIKKETHASMGEEGRKASAAQRERSALTPPKTTDCNHDAPEPFAAPPLLEGSARNLADIRKKVCMFGYQPTTSEVSLINDLLYELHCYREGGITEDMLRRNGGYIKVGRGCIIAPASEKPSNDPSSPTGSDKSKGNP